MWRSSSNPPCGGIVIHIAAHTGTCISWTAFKVRVTGVQIQPGSLLAAALICRLENLLFSCPPISASSCWPGSISAFPSIALRTLHDSGALQQGAGSTGGLGQEVSFASAMCLLRGRAFGALENRGRAAVWFRAALQADPFCYEAFQVNLAFKARTRNMIQPRTEGPLASAPCFIPL